MNDVRDNIFSFLDDWYGRLNDIIEDLESNGFSVLNATDEWIDVEKDEKEYVLKLGGTERTITINTIKALDESTDSEKELYNKVIKKYLDGDNVSEIAADLNITRADVKVCIDEYMTNRKKNKTLIEGGIYPTTLAGGVDVAFLKIINEILGGNITEVDNLELIPSLGFGGAGRYWYRASITLDEDTIVNFITTESTPEAKRLLDNGSLIINPYSDITIDCSANSVQYQDGTTLDALNDSDADMKTLDNESDIIGEAIISKLVEAEDKIIEVLKKYEDIDDEELDESLIIIEEAWDDENEINIRNTHVDSTPFESYKGYDIYRGVDEFDDDVYFVFISNLNNVDTDTSEKISNDIDEIYNWIDENPVNKSLVPIEEENDEFSDDELASIYGGDTAQSQKDIAEDEIAASKLETFDDWKEPKLGKKIKQLKCWKIYQGTDSSGNEVFRCFTPDEYRPEVGYEDWECETLEQAISWIENYDLEESKKVNNEDNKDNNKKSSNGESSDLEEGLIVIERVTFGDYEKNVFDALDNIEFLASSYEELNRDTLRALIAKLEDELEVLNDINMKLLIGVKQFKL